MSGEVMPFLRPDPAVIDAGDWQLFDGDENAPLPAVLPTWDYQTDLRLHRVVRVDVEETRRQSSIAPDIALRLAVEWTSSASKLSGLACTYDVDAATPVFLSARLRGEDLGGKVTLRTRLVLAADASKTGSFIAFHAGDVLYEDTVDVLLQGSEAMFPISVIDFAAAGLDADARWYLDTPPDPATPVAGGLRLYLNQRDAELVTAATRAESASPTQQRLLDVLHADLTRQLVDIALRSTWREGLEEALNDPDSFGATLSSLLDTLFYPDRPETMAALRDTDPGRFASRLQGSIVRILRGGA